MALSFLERAVKANSAYEVAMDEVKFLAFDQNGLASIGTANLNGCSAVMIVSIHGAILAHIPPRPNAHSQDLGAGDRHAQAKMHEVAQLYRAYGNSFPTGGSNWVVCAVYEGELALPDQHSIIQESLTSLGLPHSSVAYKAETAGKEFPGRGTVFVDGSGHVPVVYVEDREVSNGSHWSSSTPTSNPYGAGSSTCISQTPAISGGYFTYAQATPISYSTGSSAYQLQASAPSSGTFAYTQGVSTSHGAGPSTNPSQSLAQAGPSQVAASSQASYKEPYYYVKDRHYFLCENGKHTPQSTCPKKVWVLNEKGWSASNGKKWRYLGENKISYL